MKMKNIMLITFLLLAVLTIGAASAADDVVSDDIAVVDEGDAIIADPVDDGDGDDPDDPEIDPDDEGEEDDITGVVVHDVSRDKYDEIFAELTVAEKEGVFTITTIDNSSEEEIELLYEDLSTTNRACEQIEDGEKTF